MSYTLVYWQGHKPEGWKKARAFGIWSAGRVSNQEAGKRAEGPIPWPPGGDYITGGWKRGIAPGSYMLWSLGAD